MRWIASYTVLGPYDYADIFEAPDNEAATKVAVVIRSFGHATTEIFALRRRLSRRAASMAEACGWGKFIGMVATWGVDLASRMAGVDIYAVEGFYIPYLYAMSDQIGASIAGLAFLRRQGRTWLGAAAEYLRHPVMLASLAIILLVPLGLLIARLLGFSPTTQVYTALETIAANLCWIPPLVGWVSERLRQA